MEFTLAHDENGCPVDVPATATGWLVRRHGGGRGRPGAVYDVDGRPLVVPLDATAAELRSHGCRAATYRLDAVDVGRKLVGVTAYTELRSDGGEDEDVVDGGGGRGDAAVAALARAVEAMQRVQAERERAQAERERAQAEMLARLIERLAPPPPVVHRNAPDVLREFSDVQKVIKKLVPEVEPADGEESKAFSVLEMVSSIVNQVAAVVVPVMQARAVQSGAAAKATEPKRAPEPAAESARAEPAVGSEAPVDGAAVEKKLEGVFALLTTEQAQHVRKLSEKMPAAVLDQAMRQLLTMTAEDAAAELRRLLGTGAGGNGVKPKPAADAPAEKGAA